MRKITYDHRAVVIDGNRTLILSGAIHYPRSTPDSWEDLIQQSKDAGLNTIETYVFWNLHERERGQFDFTGRLDILRFGTLVADAGMNLILRIGPYICGETNYGGFPFWLRDIPGMMMRTWNEPFMREMEAWVRRLADYLLPLSPDNGGPLILAEIENEYNALEPIYGSEGIRYVEWATDLAMSLGLGVPWLTCLPNVDAIESIHGFTGHGAVPGHFDRHPDQPALWTEHWPGWYRTFGYPRHKRSGERVAYSTARFFAAGGTGVNYYMWHAGTNFAREGMYLVSPDYDMDTPLNQAGLPTDKYYHVKRVHECLASNSDLLLSAEMPTVEQINSNTVAYRYSSAEGTLDFLCNDSVSAHETIMFNGREHQLPPESVTVLRDGKVVMSTGDPIERTVTYDFEPVPLKISTISHYFEPLPHERRSNCVADQPREQLSLTLDRTDYCWYSTTVTAHGSGELVLTRAADLAYVFVDGRLCATTATPLGEDRGKPDTDAFTQRFPLEVADGPHTLSILCTAIGLIKHDTMLGFANMVEERKGLWGTILWNGDQIDGPWQMTAGLMGENANEHSTPSSNIPWKLGPVEVARPLTWWRFEFTKPHSERPFSFDLKGLTKGLMWLNDQLICRYWLTPGIGPSFDWVEPFVQDNPDGDPPQRYYYVPQEWLEESNTLVIFDEAGGNPNDIGLMQWMAS
ncbi:MAG TPA: beta-galactosidase [Capsulimonadaceae bacterium]|jgi:hypothetical protein